MQLTARADRRNSIAINLLDAAILTIALAGCATAPAPAIAPPIAIPTRTGELKLCTGAPTPPPNLASNPNYVEFSVDIIDSTDAPTIGLTQSDFVATENDRPIPIAYFRADQHHPPVSIAILVDKSGSMVTKLPVVTAGVDALMTKLDACDEVMLYAFGIRSEVVQDFTTDHALVGERLKLVGAGGETPFYDGVRQGTRLLDMSHYPDRVAIIFTDDVAGLFGSESLDNASTTASRKDIVSMAVNSQRRYFVVGVGQPGASTNELAIAIGPWVIGGTPGYGVGAQDLKAFTTDLQGQFFLVSSEPDKNAPKVKAQPPDNNGYPSPGYTPLAADPSELHQFAASLASQIDTHYTIGFISPRRPSSAPHDITIKATRPTTRATYHQIPPPLP